MNIIGSTMIIVMLMIFFLFGLISYIFNSIGLYILAKRKEEKIAWFSWIPYLNRYLLGKLTFESKLNVIFYILLVIIELILTMSLFFISLADMVLLRNIFYGVLILSVIISVYTFVAHYILYKKYSKSTIIMTIIDVISYGLLGPFFIFAIRNNEEN